MPFFIYISPKPYQQSYDSRSYLWTIKKKQKIHIKKVEKLKY
jgi:hypothetical protein